MGSRYSVPARYREIWDVVSGFGRRPFTASEITDAGFDPHTVGSAMMTFNSRGLITKVGRADGRWNKVTLWQVRRYGEGDGDGARDP